MVSIEHELIELRLNKVRRDRTEIARLKSTYKIFDLNRFSLNKDDRGRYKRNILIVNKLLKILPYNNYNPFHLYINNIKIERFKLKISIYLKKICEKNNIPDDIMLYIMNNIK